MLWICLVIPSCKVFNHESEKWITMYFKQPFSFSLLFCNCRSSLYNLYIKLLSSNMLLLLSFLIVFSETQPTQLIIAHKFTCRENKSRFLFSFTSSLQLYVWIIKDLRWKKIENKFFGLTLCLCLIMERYQVKIWKSPKTR